MNNESKDLREVVNGAEQENLLVEVNELKPLTDDEAAMAVGGGIEISTTIMYEGVAATLGTFGTIGGTIKADGTIFGTITVDGTIQGTIR